MVLSMKEREKLVKHIPELERLIGQLVYATKFEPMLPHNKHVLKKTIKARLRELYAAHKVTSEELRPVRLDPAIITTLDGYYEKFVAAFIVNTSAPMLEPESASDE